MSTNRDPIQVIYYPVKGDPEPIVIDNSLEKLQKLVGGYIEPVHSIRVDPRIDESVKHVWGLKKAKPTFFIVNEDGLIHDLPRNPHYPCFVGDVFIMLCEDLK